MFLCMVLVSLLSCQRESVTKNANDSRIEARTDEGRSSSGYNLFTRVGHDGTKCTGCIMRNGNLIHVDCQGYGNECVASTTGNLISSGSEISFMTTDTFGLTSEDFFYMPARSLFCPTIGPEHYLNIPAQVVYRDSAKLQFTFTGLFYSETPAYSND